MGVTRKQDYWRASKSKIVDLESQKYFVKESKDFEEKGVTCWGTTFDRFWTVEDWESGKFYLT